MNLPNQLTVARVVMIPLFILFFYLQFKGHYFVALAVFAIASFTDFLDGHIARKYNLITNLGKFLDPVADKILVAAAMIVLLTVPSFFTVGLGSWALIAAGCCVAVIMGRELLVSGFRMVAADAGIVIAADKIGKYKTVTQLISLLVLLAAGGLSEFLQDHLAVRIVDYVGLGFFALATLLTIISGINYVVKNIQVLKV
ncbi:MAG: CDP-diacylglycerol--glycerol-3-phosphate 3-phosphatidyltransferase [Clostridia bacterium]|nr:CDP-diacylglycerol--glycerol-3-phosphate 3-phosphatidyltransferase [Clostridia bacterium]